MDINLDQNKNKNEAQKLNDILSIKSPEIMLLEQESEELQKTRSAAIQSIIDDLLEQQLNLEKTHSLEGKPFVIRKINN